MYVPCIIALSPKIIFSEVAIVIVLFLLFFFFLLLFSLFPTIGPAVSRAPRCTGSLILLFLLSSEFIIFILEIEKFVKTDPLKPWGKWYVRSHYLVLVVALVFNIIPLIEATAESGPFFHLFHLRAVAHVAIVSPEELGFSKLS